MNRDPRKPDQDASSSLEWLAFCYVAHELSDADEAEFEARLESDDLAQQAVIDAVKLTQCIAATQAVDSSTTTNPTTVSRLAPATVLVGRPGRLLKRAGILITLAASLALIVLSWNGAWQNDTLPSTASTEADLAFAWANTLVSLDENDFEEDIHDETSLFADDDETENWMVVALLDQTDLMEGVER